VEGTEFWVEVTADQALLGVFSGRVVAENPAGTLTLGSGESAAARLGQVPAPVAVVRPRDRVAWALHYPSVLDYRAEQFPDLPGQAWPAVVRRSIEAHRSGEMATAFATLESAPPDVSDPRFFTYRAVLLLSVGRVDEARTDIARALSLRAANPEALALQAMIAVVQGRLDEALRDAERGVALDPRAAAARVALSYAHQARADLDAALADLRAAVAIDARSALTYARYAEILLATGRLREARSAADRAVALGPSLSRAHTVLGFVLLAQLQIAPPRVAFERAIALDQADPLPRLGLGLARIRQSDLDDGRREIEIAASLDPGNALVRSYLGKAYYEERRDTPAAEELQTAKQLDPNDPTPWFYDALRKQSVNRPVDALHDLQTAIALNDNRAVYRSRLLLDEDLAARSASLARIYDDLGFQQLALAEGWKSVNADPGSHSAHRFLADSYSVLPRHEVARVSELLQAQLLQPLNLVPVQPQLAVGKLFIVSGAGPADPGFNEFNALFERNGVSLYGAVVAGGKGTFGDSLAVAGLWNRLSFSAGQFHYETDGFRKNNDLTHDVYDLFAQARLTSQTSVQAEYRATRLERGDVLRFDPDRFNPMLRQEEDTDTLRVGFRHAFSPRSLVLASVARGTVDASRAFSPDFRFETEDTGYTGELQHILRWGPVQVVSGVGQFSGRRTSGFRIFGERIDAEDENIRHTNGYLYSSINVPKSVVSVLGVSVDHFDGVVEREQVNPKAGVIWAPLPGTTIRAAGFRVLKRTLVSNQTIEPTQVAGFNQFFDDPEGSSAWRYGVGVDQALSRNLYVGAEVSQRDLRVPFTATDITGQVLGVQVVDWQERVGRGYVYWTPHPWWALTVEYLYERLERDAAFVGEEEIRRVRTHRVPLGVSLFHPSGVSARLRTTYTDQKGEFGDPVSGTLSGSERFWVVDASLAYRLPNRWGVVSVEARNLFDERFRFQETDPASPVVSPGRLLLFKLNLAY
jgi:tetratricopeptide (TPR) repeat protein